MDMLAQPHELDKLLGETVPVDTATLLIQLATGAVQAAAGQRLIQASADTVELMGTMDRWLSLPERPVSAVTSVTLDGAAVADFKKFGSRLWREKSWASSAYEPSEVVVVCDHGFAKDDHRLGMAKDVVLMLAAQSFDNPTSATGFSIDDYREQRAQVSDAMLNQLPDGVRRSLRRAYGSRSGLVRVG